jgi:hypothetical protein
MIWHSSPAFTWSWRIGISLLREAKSNTSRNENRGEI